jgi:hypothetical protein
MRTKFLLALLGIAQLDLDGEFHELLIHSIKTGGIAIQNPVDVAMHAHKMSLSATSNFVNSMVNKEAHLDLEDHCK